MAARNYQPTLRRLGHLLSKFISRYQTQIMAGATSPQAIAIAAVQAAVDQMLFELGEGGGQ